MKLLGIGDIIKSVGGLATDLITTDKERLQMAIEDRKLDLEEKRIDQATGMAQVEVNKIEAGSASLFKGGWRPFVGWVCGFALAYHFILQPFLIFAIVATGADLPPLPQFDMSTLMTVLMGLLGLGGLRTFEKSKGVAAA